MIKLSIIKTNKEWLEATWIEEITTEDIVETNVLWCESFSGHNEHIQILKVKCLEFGTELSKEDETIIAEISEAYVYPTEEEIQADIVKNKVQEAKIYLASTDYKMTVDYFATLTVTEQEDIKVKRAEAREYIRANDIKLNNGV